MAKLVVRLHNKLVQEYDITGNLKIGRDKGDLILKNPAISSTHARLAVEGDRYVLHDMDSTNGTFVNKGRITSQQLHHGDLITIGKYELEFINPDEKPEENIFGSLDAGMTVMINTEDILREERFRRGKDGKKERHARLLMVKKSGGADRVVEYRLKKETTLIGTGNNVDIHLKGLTIGGVAAAVQRIDDRYVIKFMGGLSKLKVNNEKVAGERELHKKDKIEIASYLFEFLD